MRTAVEVQPDPVSRLDPAPGERPGDGPRLPVEARVAPRVLPARDGDRLRRASGRLHDLLGQGSPRRAGPSRCEPVEPVVLLGSQHGYPGRGTIPMGLEIVEDRLVVAEQVLEERCLEPIGPELHRDLRRDRPLGGEQRQVELGRAEVEDGRREAGRPEARSRGNLLVDEHALEHGVPVGSSGRSQLLGEHVERDRGVAHRLPHVRRVGADAVPDRAVLVDRDPQDHRVQEVADHPRGGLSAHRDRGRDGEVPAGQVAMQQQAEGEPVDQERRGAGRRGDAPDPRPGRGVEVARQPLPPRLRSPLRLPLERQGQVVGPGVETTTPVREVALALLGPGAADRVDVVVVLGSMRRVRPVPGIARRHLVPEEGQRPLVGEDVVQHEQEQSLAAPGLLDQHETQQGPRPEVERPTGGVDRRGERAAGCGGATFDRHRLRRARSPAPPRRDGSGTSSAAADGGPPSRSRRPGGAPRRGRPRPGTRSPGCRRRTMVPGDAGATGRAAGRRAVRPRPAASGGARPAGLAPPPA